MVRTDSKLNSGFFDELIIDNFAGGGGASMGIEDALGRSVDIAVNHDAEAVEMHKTNHPHTRHLCQDVFEVNAVEVCGGRPVGLAWFSPDCKHFSKAKGGKPVSKKIRGLAWVVIRWAAKVRPRVIMLENVEEFSTWGPLTGENKPCPKRKGQTFRQWVGRLRALGYVVEWRELRACDFGAPTIRKRLFLIARCDGEPIVWPTPTHASPKEYRRKGLKRWRTAAQCLDWWRPCPSIFERKRPLAEKTQQRIARGIVRYVIEAKKPFIVRCNHGGDHFRGQSIEKPPTEPVGTITAKNDRCVVAPYFVPRNGERVGQAPRCSKATEPMPTVVPTANGAGLVSAFLAKHYGGVVGHEVEKPAGTVTSVDHHSVVAVNLSTFHSAKSKGDSRCNSPDEPLRVQDTQNRHAVVTSNLVKLRGTCRDGQKVDQPMPTVTASGTHVGEVRAFLLKYYGQGTGQRLSEPAHTVTSKDRMGLVTVHGTEYQIADIGMRMLEPCELYRAQGFPASYVIAPVVNGRPLPKSSQVRLCGNSVAPPVVSALVKANFGARARKAVPA